MDQHELKLPSKLTIDDLLAKVSKTTYIVVPETTTTICVLTLKNGFVITGTSACIDQSAFSVATGERYAFENAIDKLWELEGYLLCEIRYKNNQQKA